MAVTTNSTITGVGGSSTSGGSGGSPGGGANITLLSNISATGDGSVFTWPGGTGTFSGLGTFGSSVLSLKYLGPDGSTYLTAGSLSANGGFTFFLPVNTPIKANLTGGSPSGIYASVAA